MNDMPDRRTSHIRERAEQARLSQDAAVNRAARANEFAIERERQRLHLQQEKRAAGERAKSERQQRRRAARQAFTDRINRILPTVGRRAMIAGPILAPMTVAWIGQISFAMDTLGWIIIGALVFAAAWELTTAFTGWMYHQARKDGDRGTLFRVATWIFASSAGAMNYWHALPDGGSIYHPTPKAVSYGTMSLVGISLWELYSSLIHRKHLREQGIVPSARPRFGILRWARFPRITWHAWSLAVRYGIKTVDEAWDAAVTEIDRLDRAKAVRRDRKRLAKDPRPEVRVTVVRTVERQVPPAKTALRLYRVEHPELRLGLACMPGRTALGGSETGPVVGSETGPANRSQTQTSAGSETRSGDGSETSDRTRSEVRDENRSETGPRRRSRRRSKTGPKVKVSDRLAEARSVDKAYLAEHGRHIPAEKLAKALSIGKPAALDLVKQVRGGHIDVAK